MSSTWEPADSGDSQWNTQDDPGLQQAGVDAWSSNPPPSIPPQGDAWSGDPLQGMFDQCCAFGTYYYS